MNESGQYDKNRKRDIIISGNFVYSNFYDTYRGKYLSQNPFLFSISYNGKIPHKKIKNVIFDEILKFNQKSFNNIDLDNIMLIVKGNNAVVYTKDYDEKPIGSRRESQLFSYTYYCDESAKKCLIYAKIGIQFPSLGGKNISYFGKLFPFYSNEDIELLKQISGTIVDSNLLE